VVLVHRGWPAVRRARGDRFNKNKELLMNWDQIKGDWKKFGGKVKETWGKMTDDDIKVVAGKRDQLLGAIQRQYGIARDEAERQVGEFERACGDEYVEAPGSPR
jgi:uncharacterized protein YjbJ (UPF0337 family)